MRVAENLKLWVILSLVIIGIGLVFGVMNGLNYGIDFTGGTLIQVEIGREFEVSEIKDSIDQFDLKEDVIHSGKEKTGVIIKTKESLSSEERLEVFEVLKNDFNLSDEDFLGAEQFGPAIGKEIQRKAFFAIAFASVGMLIYIWWRFEIIYGVTSIIALVHDVIMLLAIYAIFRIPVNSSFIAAVLTIVGYSINDTIVVFDRIRENVKIMKKESHIEIANTSLRQSLARSINTSLTTLLVIGTLYILGVESIREFALPLMAGVIIGTYSSVFIASPLWAFLRKNIKQRKTA